MKLSHYTSKPIAELRDAEQPDYAYVSVYEKPRGLWVSVDGEHDWAAWCEGESFGIGELQYKIELADDANVLTVSNDMNIVAFQQRFGVPSIYNGHDFGTAIDWQSVANQYDGIIIAPYHWAYRMSMSWYYPWDCASGCIWKARAIKTAVLSQSSESLYVQKAADGLVKLKAVK